MNASAEEAAAAMNSARRRKTFMMLLGDDDDEPEKSVPVRDVEGLGMNVMCGFKWCLKVDEDKHQAASIIASGLRVRAAVPKWGKWPMGSPIFRSFSFFCYLVHFLALSVWISSLV